MLTVKHLPTTILALSTLTLPGWLQAATEGDASRGAEAAAVCTSCHQADGSGKHNEQGESWPQLAGLDAGYLAKQLRDYQSGRRQNATMKPFANMLSDQQIVDVAQFYSKMAPRPGQGGESASTEVLQRGRILAQRGDWSAYIVSCQSCHGPDNQGVGTVFPGIAGQHAGYIVAQLEAWQAGERTNDPQDLMGTIARRMNDDDIRAVAAWLANQPPAAELEEIQP
ncbi:Cytochrome c553 [Marinobacter daqiaonensis]|uniref:Cytochrome c553 n=1 Tax=Marinobacter daqiaonensis TaxID=650891 RepID=A0A1I6JQE0_9GAMM|nr:c-type cytochrome [Marinobacter daqiaonensis]SFR81167.1 Cytochrome c553 [Marinobacter daqiaonensis]